MKDPFDPINFCSNPKILEKQRFFSETNYHIRGRGRGVYKNTKKVSRIILMTPYHWLIFVCLVSPKVIKLRKKIIFCRVDHSGDNPIK